MSQQVDLSNFNSMIESANNTISCNSDCKRNKRVASLRRKMGEAKSKVVLAEPEYQNAVKNYVVYTAGENSYDEMMKQQYTELADTVAAKMQGDLNDTIGKIIPQIHTYEGLMVNFRNVVDLFEQYKVENMALERRLKEDTNDIITNERKTFYEDQEIDVLDTSYYYFFIFIYLVIVVSFIAMYVMRNIRTLSPIYVCWLLFFIFLPWITQWGLKLGLFVLYRLASLFPKNVYLSL